MREAGARNENGRKGDKEERCAGEKERESGERETAGGENSAEEALATTTFDWLASAEQSSCTLIPLVVRGGSCVYLSAVAAEWR